MFGIFQIGAVDCLEDEELCEEFTVFETPTIKIFTEYASDEGEVFRGKNDWKSISAAAANKMQSFVNIVTVENYQQFIDQDPQKNKILLFSERKSTSPLFKSVSKIYKDKLLFGEVRKHTEQELFDKFKISQTPTLMALTDPYSYQGEIYKTDEIKID